MAERKECGAKVRNSDPPRYCKQRPVKGNKRCRFHGGLSLGGADHPNYKGRGYSKYLPQRIADRYFEALADSELSSLNSELALIDARMGEVLGKLDTGEDGDAWTNVGATVTELRSALNAAEYDKAVVLTEQLDDYVKRAFRDIRLWDDVHGLIEQRRKVADTERKREELLQATMNLKQVAAFMGALQLAINDEVKDPNVRTRLAQRLRLLLTHNINFGSETKQLEAGFDEAETIDVEVSDDGQ